jgi:hypothetical protein
MAEAQKDGNYVSTLLGVSSVDGVTPVTIYADPTTHRLKVDLTGGGSGDVVGPVGATDNAVARFNGITGLIVQNSGVIISDLNAMSGVLSLTLDASGSLAFGAVTILSDAAGTTTLSNIDAIDATTEATIETAIDTLANLTSIQGQTISISAPLTIPADPNADRILFWDDTAGATAWLELGTGLSITGTTIESTGGGNVTKVGTPANDQVGVWTGDGTIEGTAGLTFASNVLGVGTAANGTVQSNGNFDLILRTGNATTGNITITDGANGNITLAPNGVGAVSVQATGATTYFSALNGSNYGEFEITPTYAQTGVYDTSSNSEIVLYAQDGASNITITDTSAGATGPILYLYHNSASPAANDNVGLIYFNGEDSAGNSQIYGTIAGTIVDATSASEAGKLVFGVGTAGGSTNRLQLFNASLSPATNDGLTLGTTALQYSDLFLAEGGVINWDNGDVTLTQTGNVLAVAGGDLRVATADVGTNADSVPTISSTNTLTNKRITKRVGTTTSSATPTINTDNVDFYSLTAQTADITSFTTNLSGTPTDGQTLWIAITGTAARAITWGASFEASTVALPTTTVTTNRLDVGFVWNTATSKWRCVASC